MVVVTSHVMEALTNSILFTHTASSKRFQFPMISQWEFLLRTTVFNYSNSMTKHQITTVTKGIILTCIMQILKAIVISEAS